MENVANNVKECIKDCVDILEIYYTQVKPLKKIEVIGFKEEHMKKWNTIFYPQLVQSGVIKDSSFFENPVKNPNYGIGQDGYFCKYEYCNFLYQSYKILAQDARDNTGTSFVKGCISMLEPYVGQFENKGTNDSNTITLSNSDKDKWDKDYYSLLSKKELIPDGSFFGDTAKNPNYGIGEDGSFYGKELLHFLYQSYKYVYYFSC